MVRLALSVLLAGMSCGVARSAPSYTTTGTWHCPNGTECSVQCAPHVAVLHATTARLMQGAGKSILVVEGTEAGTANVELASFLLTDAFATACLFYRMRFQQ